MHIHQFANYLKRYDKPIGKNSVDYPPQALSLGMLIFLPQLR